MAPVVGLARYTTPRTSVRQVIELAGGLGRIRPSERVFVKPNLVYWSRGAPFPKWGCLTTSRVVHDIVALLAEHGVSDIVLGEGTVMFDPRDHQTQLRAFEALGYGELERRYGVRLVPVLQRRFDKVDLGDGLHARLNRDALEADVVVDLPVLKTHAQAVVSLGIKNLKGLLNPKGRRDFHRVDPDGDLHDRVARLADVFPRVLTVIDGIYSLERGPGPDGKAHRANALAASWDPLSADQVGARLLGHPPETVPHLARVAARWQRPADGSDVEVRGEPVETLARPHKHQFAYDDEAQLPAPMARMGLVGLTLPQVDLSLCTYCSLVVSPMLGSIAFAWRGKAWDDVEVLTGKSQRATPGKRTVLLGQCLVRSHRDHPDLADMLPVDGCPPAPEAIVQALHTAGIAVDPSILTHLDQAASLQLHRYRGKPEFDEAFFRIEPETG
ncbi:MAG: DUF362 domain-containing protein [Myxococcota bacterium]|jgi:uncharacterized protein (DUF362 family)|nr:DUF362 domain-containing protein [Myxococcota bacterium]